MLLGRDEQLSDRELVDRWTEENLADIIRAMTGMRRVLLKRWRDNSNRLRRLDSSRYSLSEMPLCESWELISPPPGFRVVGVERGEALLYCPGDDPVKEKPFDTKNHQFARNGKGILICFTFGQFHDYQNPLISTDGWKPGDRVNVYKAMAPDLIETYEHHGVVIARLYGRYDDIRTRLGLWYRKRV